MSSLHFTEEYAKTYGWQRPYGDALTRYNEEYRGIEHVCYAQDHQSELLANELERWT